MSTKTSVAQQAIERAMVEMGKNRSVRARAKAKEKRRESKTPEGRELLLQCSAKFEVEIREWLRERSRRKAASGAIIYPLLKVIPPPIISKLVTRIIVDGMTQEARRYNKVALTIGRRLEDESRHEWLAKNHKAAWRDWLKSCKDLIHYDEKRRRIQKNMEEAEFQGWEPWTQNNRMHVGALCLDLFANSTGVVTFPIFQYQNYKAQKSVEPTEETLKWLESAGDHSDLLTPLWMPCIQRPLDWSDPTNGGFHDILTCSNAWPGILKNGGKKLREELKAADMSLAYQAVNACQQTGWRINRDIWEVFRTLWKQGSTLADMPYREALPSPPKPPEADTNPEVMSAWKSERYLIYRTNQKNQIKRLELAQLNHIAEKFADLPEFFFVYQMDWRGRLYPQSTRLHPQGPDLVKAMLQFSEGATIVGEAPVAWFLVHGAGAWGNDKVSYADRIQWTQDHEEEILKVASDPLQNEWWTEADKPWQFLAWCFEYSKWTADPENYVSHLPVHQDATQSGIQIMSLLLRDSYGGAATNCLPADKPQDLYATVAEELVRNLEKEALKDGEHAKFAKQWLEFGVDRSTTKRPVMTRVYNATLSAMISHLREWAYETAKKTGQEFPRKGYAWLARQVWKSMTKSIQGTIVVQEWLGMVAREFTRHKQVIRWTSPIGLPVCQDYRKRGMGHVRTRIGERFRHIQYFVASDHMDRKKMHQAFAPNVVHTLDAAVLMTTVLIGRAAGITSWSVIHDSFGVLPRDADTLFSAIREAYVSIFGEDWLQTFKDELEAQLPDGIELPELPVYGGLDVTQVRDSLYFFN